MPENNPEIWRVQIKKWENFEKLNTPESTKIDEKLQKLELSLVKTQSKEVFIEKMRNIFLGKGAEIKIENNKILILIWENADINEISKIIEWVKIEWEKIGFDFNMDWIISNDEFVNMENKESPNEEGFIWKFGRFYMSWWVENWDLPNDINNIQYHWYMVEKSFSGTNLGITAKNLSKTSENQNNICFADKNLIKTQDWKSYLVVIWESDDNQKIHLDQTYNDLNDLTSKIREKSKTKIIDGKEVLWVEAWISEMSGTNQNQMNIYEVWEMEVHQFVKVDIVDKWLDEDHPIRLIKNDKWEYNYEFFHNKKISKLTFTQKEIDELKKLYEIWNDGSIKQKKDLAVKIDLTNKWIDPKEIENIISKEWFYFMFEKFDINWNEFDNTCKITKDENSLKITPTEKITKREIIDLWFGVKFDKTNFLYNSPFIKELSNIENWKQSLILKWLYGWWDMDADIEFSSDFKSVKKIKLQTVWNEININDINLNFDIKNEKDINTLYVNIMRIISRSLNISYMGKTWIIQDWNFKYDAKSSNVNLSYNNLPKVPQEKWNKYYETIRKSYNDEYWDISFLISSGLINTTKFKYADVKSFKFQWVWWLSAKFESSTKWSEAIWYDRTWWASYWIYQIATKTWGMNEFLKFIQSKNLDIYWRLNNKKSDMWRVNWSFANEWIAISRDKTLSKNFAELQHNYVKATHYDVAMSKLNNPKLVAIINNSKTLQEVMRSTATQHGWTWAASIFNEVYRESITEKDLVSAIYKERGTKFGNSTSQVRQSVKNRFLEEKSIAIAMLEKEKKWNFINKDSYQNSTQVVEASKNKTFSQLRDWEKIKLWENQTINYEGKEVEFSINQKDDNVIICFADKRYQWKMPLGAQIQTITKKWNWILLNTNLWNHEMKSQEFVDMLAQINQWKQQLQIWSWISSITLDKIA